MRIQYSNKCIQYKATKETWLTKRMTIIMNNWILVFIGEISSSEAAFCPFSFLNWWTRSTTYTGDLFLNSCYFEGLSRYRHLILHIRKQKQPKRKLGKQTHRFCSASANGIKSLPDFWFRVWDLQTTKEPLSLTYIPI